MEERSSIPLIGEKFPEIEVLTTHGTKKLPADYQGRWFVLFSHPADFTPVCTTEFVAFQKRYEEFQKLNTDLIGLSIDQVFSHIKWIEWIQEKLNVTIQFPVIADDTGRVGFKARLDPSWQGDQYRTSRFHCRSARDHSGHLVLSARTGTEYG